jgi:hypothetical protein
MKPIEIRLTFIDSGRLKYLEELERACKWFFLWDKGIDEH